MVKKTTFIIFKVFALSFIFGPAEVRAQDGLPTVPPMTHLPIIGMPSPTSASLGVYANYPIGNFTGVPDISVPIYEVNEGGYKLPISLSYNASGIKVSDVASWVGLGWSLNAGGVVTRNIIGAADDQHNQSWQSYTMSGGPGTLTGMTPVGNNGFLYYNYNQSADFINNEFATGSPYVPYFNPTANDPAAQMRSLRWYAVDTDPDIFCFNFNGHTGKFVFSQGTDPSTNQGSVAPDQHRALLIPYQDLKVSYAFNGVPVPAPGGGTDPASWLASFTIVDEEGNSYLFSKTEYISYDTYYKPFFNPASPISSNTESFSDGYTAWYLTKITTALGKVINFNYVYENYVQGNQAVSEWRAFNLANYPVEMKYSITTNSVQAPRLTSIEGDDFKVFFDANLAREDLKGANALTAIRIYSKDHSGNQTFIKEFDLTQYFQVNFADPYASNDVTNGDPNKRLMLQLCTEKGADGTTKPPYQFGYNSDIVLPNRWSYQQDFWGYFNNNGANDLRPTVYVYPQATDHVHKFSLFPEPGSQGFTFAGSDRTTNPVAALSGTLNNIVYPTGGTTQFQFEPNSFYYLGQNFTGGGLRLRQSIEYDGISHNNDIVRSYTYTQSANPSLSSGVLFNMPVFAYTTNFLGYWIPTNYYTPALVADPSTMDYYNHYLVVGSAPTSSMSGFDGVNIGYSEITESINGNGRTVWKYSTPARYGDLSDQSGACQPSASGYCDGLFVATANQTTFLYNWNTCVNPKVLDLNTAPDLTGVDVGAYSYPLPPNTNYEWNRGLLLSKMVYNQNGKIVSEEDDNYILYSPGMTGPQYVNGLRRSLMSNYHLYLGTCGDTYGEWNYDVYAPYRIIAAVAKVVSSRVVKSFDINNPATYTQSVTNYAYSLNCKQPSLVEVNTSNGELIDKHLSYPMDYGPPSSSSDPRVLGLINLQNNHVIKPVIEQYVERKNTDGTSKGVFEGAITTYKPNQPLPDVIYQSQSPLPVANYSKASFATVLSTDPSYLPYIVVDAYDALGNTLQQHKVGDMNESYIWDYNNLYPVAKVMNAGASDVAYTSFEADGKGGWGFSGVPVVFSSAPTGGKCYDLSTDLRIAKNNLNSSKTYVVSYWSNSGPCPVNGTTPVVRGVPINGWTYFEHRITGVTTVQIGGTGLIDELRLYPLDAQMTTFTYTPMIGMTSKCGPDNRINYYEYDAFDRLLDIRDQYSNIVQQFTYKYHN